MICSPCKQAGEEMKANDGQPDEFNISNAVALHRRCEAPTTCTCQHRVGTGMLNQERIQDGRNSAAPEL